VSRREIVVKYPRIADACQSIEHRGGGDFFKLSGIVTRVSTLRRSGTARGVPAGSIITIVAFCAHRN
jgi:hypothetical protein